MPKALRTLIYTLGLIDAALCAENQTPTLSPFADGSQLPFKISITQAGFSLPQGLQSFVWGTSGHYWLLLGGRTNGLHGFSGDSFPASRQNTTVFVVNPATGETWSRSLLEPVSGLTPAQIDALSSTSMEKSQVGDTLYLVGGYGFDTTTQSFTTKCSLTAINIPGMIDWVLAKNTEAPLAPYIRQVCRPFLQVTGGGLRWAGRHHPFLLIFGQNFIGSYSEGSNGIYTEQIRPFRIFDNGCDLQVYELPSAPRNPNYRRRDMNIVPIVQLRNCAAEIWNLGLAGVFTESKGAWTVPVWIDPDGNSYMPNPEVPETLKQGINVYASAWISLYSRRANQNFIVLPGGITYQYLEGGQVGIYPLIGWTNQMAVLRVDPDRYIRQYLIPDIYPTIPAPFGQVGNPLRFGGSAEFIPAACIPAIQDKILDYDALKGSSVFLGYIVGGIQSSVFQHTANSDTAASPYVFKVHLTKGRP